ncbi:MAG: DUF5615 family PIN-like protein [Acidobacteria bacterium]|nr:DUF5615 family PIN-like protein [Acidobacteriota bacterium]
MRFVLDEDVDVLAVGSFLRQRGHKCWSVVDAGIGGADDDAVAIYVGVASSRSASMRFSSVISLRR